MQAEVVANIPGFREVSMMKNGLGVLVLTVFMLTSPLGMARAENNISCCIKSECHQMTKAECWKAKGKAVKDCKYCNPPPKGTTSASETWTKKEERRYQEMSTADLI